MRLWVVRFACVLVLGSSSASFGQEPSGPRTLENLLKSDDAEQSAAAAGADAGPKRPEGTVSRPKDGVQHPDLDKAWEVYEAAIGEAAEEIRAAVAKQFDKAAADGSLPVVKKWKAIGEAFDEQGTLPAEKETEKVVKTATEAFARASEDLGLAYEQTIKAVTKQAVNDKAMVEEAEKVEAELKSLDLEKAKTDKNKKAATRNINRKGLHAEYLFDGNVLDTSGNQRHGKLRGQGAAYVVGHDGRKESALDFTGSTSVDLGFEFREEVFTVAMWLMAGREQQQYANIVDNNHWGDNRNWVVQQEGGSTNKYYFGLSSKAGGDPPLNFAVGPAEWHHLAFVAGAAQTIVYLDGQIVGGNVRTAPVNYANRGTICIGSLSGSGREWRGVMDDVVIYARALSQTEIKILHKR
jgi:hypothetical protein